MNPAVKSHALTAVWSCLPGSKKASTFMTDQVEAKLYNILSEQMHFWLKFALHTVCGARSSITGHCCEGLSAELLTETEKMIHVLYGLAQDRNLAKQQYMHHDLYLSTEPKGQTHICAMIILTRARARTCVFKVLFVLILLSQLSKYSGWKHANSLW